MSKRRQKGTRNHRSLNLFEKGWLSAEVGFTIVKRSILKIKGPKNNIKSLEKQCKIDARINYTKNIEDHQKCNPKGHRKQSNIC
jgi:hypothetical protein